MNAAWLLTLALAHAAPAESGISELADRLAAAILTRFDAPEGMVVKSESSRCFVDIPLLGRGATLEWFVAVGESSALGLPGAAVTLLQPCGRIRIEAANGSVSWGESASFAGCAPPGVGDPVRIAAGEIRFAVEAGSADPALSGLVRLLAEVLPARLERSGAFALQSSIPGAAAPDLRITLRAARRSSRLAVLAELEATAPQELHDLVEVDSALLPDALWRGREDGARPAPAIARRALHSRVLAIRGPGRGWPALVLTEDALYAVRFAVEGDFDLERWLDLGALAESSAAARVPSGAIAAEGRPGDGVLCIATSALTHGWCRRDRDWEPVSGSPVEAAGRVLLAERRPGCADYDGSLRALAGALPSIQIGAFAAITSDAHGGALVARLDGSLDRLGPDLLRRETAIVATGDAWGEDASGVLALSLPVALGEPDSIQLRRPGAEPETHAVAGGAVALALLAGPGGETRMLVAVEAPGAEASTLLVLQP